MTVHFLLFVDHDISPLLIIDLDKTCGVTREMGILNNLQQYIIFPDCSFEVSVGACSPQSAFFSVDTAQGAHTLAE